jgi:hypothetical protein
MRLITIMAMLFTISAFAQTRVKENIKQQVVATSEDGASSAPQRPVRVTKPVKNR